MRKVMTYLLEGRNASSRDAAVKALEKAKQLEEDKRESMVSVRTDNRTSCELLSIKI